MSPNDAPAVSTAVTARARKAASRRGCTRASQAAAIRAGNRLRPSTEASVGEREQEPDEGPPERRGCGPEGPRTRSTALTFAAASCATRTPCCVSPLGRPAHRHHVNDERPCQSRCGEAERPRRWQRQQGEGRRASDEHGDPGRRPGTDSTLEHQGRAGRRNRQQQPVQQRRPPTGERCGRTAPPAQRRQAAARNRSGRRRYCFPGRRPQALPRRARRSGRSPRGRR